ncbi:enoyl-CoA hydratase [Antrihabitans cavernicola]|uniref:Enoyl-CoA hydratase n=1 Tax=Antrihabitans cavernicola TaxID=2495913 RepID=A0A5A7S4S6_9NOCA|nr:enoyl-CoA hydratase [Spelaeibacter cavernicola]KAA0021180.1 enoyl-CoA hydratase [Spelaeibacter cavernicola]
MIGISRGDDVVTIELQRDERRNALNRELCAALRDAVEDAAEDARAIVITGRGTAFCAGADLSEVYSDNFTDALLGMLHTIDSVPVPVIAAVNGPAIGAGTQLAVASDLRVVAPDAYFAIPAAKLGITVDRWTAQRVASLAGAGPARTMLLGVESISAADAYTFGLANKIGSLTDAQNWAATIADLAPLSLRHLKLVLNDDGSRDDETHEQRAALYAAWGSEDAKEGRLARKDKRHPKFIGR